ncbi:MAG: thymidine phosphorylase family protein [Brachybacterium paraconglomeratum]|jgi:thymidine phosphorylase|nr:thymidine phosphorylase family protein [Brachybacterium paraconglomeratum]
MISMYPARTDTPEAPASASLVRLRRLGIDTYQEPVIYMPADCGICRSEGWGAQARVEVRSGDRAVLATLNVTTDGLLGDGEAGLSEVAWRQLGVEEGALATLAHPTPLESLAALRAKIYGHRLDADDMRAIVGDIASGRYSAVHLAAFVTACAGGRLDVDETVDLTRAMIDAGERLQWPSAPVMDKHCIGGLPGNRTTMLVVPIVAAAGLVIPKTSSRAITSPAGTADAMEVVAPVTLDLHAMRRVVEREGGCIVWGGAVRLSPADDLIIRVERPLDIDSEGQLVASVLSKKVAAGSTHVLIDVPVGPTAKVRSDEAASALADRLTAVGERLGLTVRVRRSDGTQPVGRGIGPALEARDVLAVLRDEPGAADDLRRRSVALAGEVLELSARVAPGTGMAWAERLLADGSAWRKFLAICEAQGGFREPGAAGQRWVLTAPRAGRVTAIDNRRLARLAKLAGAPQAPTAGLDLHVRVGDAVTAGAPLLTLHAESPGELAYARAYARERTSILAIGGAA